MSSLLYVFKLYKGVQCQATAAGLECGADSRRVGEQNGARNGLHLDGAPLKAIRRSACSSRFHWHLNYVEGAFGGASGVAQLMCNGLESTILPRSDSLRSWPLVVGSSSIVPILASNRNRGAGR